MEELKTLTDDERQARQDRLLERAASFRSIGESPQTRLANQRGVKEVESRTCECGVVFEAVVAIYAGSRWGGLERCPSCQDKWEAEEERKTALKEHEEKIDRQTSRRDVLEEAAHFPERFLNKTYPDGQEDKWPIPWTGYNRSQSPKSFAQIIAWLRVVAKRGAAGSPSLVLQGSYGSGKTHLAVAIGAALCRLWGVTDKGKLVATDYDPVFSYFSGPGVLFTTASDFGVRLRATYRRDSEESEADVYDQIERARVVILDDVGDPTKEKDSDATRRQYFEIINRRYNADKPIILTLNFRLGKDDAALADFFSPAVYSRLVEMSKGWVVDLGTKDRRR